MEISTDSAISVIRIGLGITFIITSVYIITSEDKWTGFIKPWAKNLIPGDLKKWMYSVFILDLIVGIWLVVGFVAWLPALIGAIHLVQVLMVSGITSVTYRDIGLLATSVGLFLYYV